MKAVKALLLIALSVCLLSFPDWRSAQMKGSGLDGYLPDKTGEWLREGDPQEFRGDDLYLYINGGAEIYLEYGFSQVIVQDYRHTDGKEISLEIFEMADDASAYGIYTFKRSRTGQHLSIGDSAQLADYYLNFWAGRFCVTLTGFDESRKTQEGLKLIARAVSEQIKQRGGAPAIVSFLPEESRTVQGLKYFKGNLGLNNIYPRLLPSLSGFVEGVKGDFPGGVLAFILRYPDEETARKKLRAAKKELAENQNYRNFQEIEENLLAAQDKKSQWMFLTYSQRYILIFVGEFSVEAARKIFSEILQKVPKT
jgi:hypothetical protein